MKKIEFFSLVAMALCGIMSISCDKTTPDVVVGINGVTREMKLNVSEADGFTGTEVKSGESAVLNRVFSSKDDDFVIEEYVSDIDALIPETKGWEITTANIATRYGELNAMAFLDTLDASKNPVHVNEFNLTAKKGGSSWDWEGSDPMWRTSTPTTIWSYSPLSMGLTSSDVTDGTSGWADGEYTKLSFSHAVSDRDGASHEDLLVAYNVEQRDFQTDADGNYPIDPATKKPIFNFVAGQDEYFDIKFHHALAAVKFKLTKLTGAPAGANIHSVTLCYFDASGNIVMNDGIATSGDCVATGSGSSINFNWSNLGNNKPLHYKYPDTYPATASTIAGGYAESGEGVMFMIPQSATNVRMIVQFSNYGGSQYYTRVSPEISINWQAGKVYTYDIKIGEFHVPGEELTKLGTINIDGLKNAGTDGVLIPTSNVSSKGVTKVGLVLNSYGLGCKGTGQYAVLYAIPNGNDPYDGVSVASLITRSNPTFTYNFAAVSTTPLPNTNDKIFEYGMGGAAEETYNQNYYRFAATGSGKSALGTITGPFYYVFDIGGADTFKLKFKASATDNSGGYAANARCIIALEVEEDPDIPGNWEDFLSNY